MTVVGHKSLSRAGGWSEEIIVTNRVWHPRDGGCPRPEFRFFFAQISLRYCAQKPPKFCKKCIEIRHETQGINFVNIIVHTDVSTTTSYMHLPCLVVCVGVDGSIRHDREKSHGGDRREIHGGQMRPNPRHRGAASVASNTEAPRFCVARRLW